MAGPGSSAGGEFSHGSFTATVIQPPVMQTCSLTLGFLNLHPVVTVTWRFPAGSSYVTPGNVAYYVARDGLLVNLLPVLWGNAGLETTGPVGGTYTTQYKEGILGGLLDGLLGGSYGVYLQTVDGSGWTSTLASATASMDLGGTNPHCVITPV